MHSPLRPLLGSALLLALTAGCTDQTTPVEPAAAGEAARSVTAAALGNPVFTSEYVFESRGTPNKLSDVYEVEPGVVVAVGAQGYAWMTDTVFGFIRFKSVSQPYTNPVTLRGVWGSSRTNVVAVGIRTTPSGPVGHVFHNTGGVWEEEPVDATQLYEVFGLSSHLAYVVGTRIFRWNGSTSTPVHTEPGVTFHGVWASGANDVFAVGTGGTIVHFDGTGWQVQPTPTTQLLTGVWGFGPGDVYAVGEGGVILRYDGVDWTAVPVSSGPYIFTEVWGSSPNSVVVVGRDPATNRAVQARFNGTSWTVDPGFGPLDPITGISGSPSGRHFITSGNYLSVLSAGATRAYDFRTIWGYPDGQKFAGGRGGITWRVSGRWLPMELPGTGEVTIHVIWGSNPTQMYAGGSRGGTAALFRYDGTRWSEVPVSIAADGIHAIWGSRDTLYATGSPDKILVRPGRGVAWQEVPTHPDMDRVVSLHGRSNQNFFAATSLGDLWHYDGAAWTRSIDTNAQTGVVYHDGASVWFAPGKDYPSTYTDPLLYRRTPSGWISYQKGIISGIWGTGPNDVFFASDDRLPRWNGTFFEDNLYRKQPSDVWTSAAAPNVVWVVAGGTILRGTR